MTPERYKRLTTVLNNRQPDLTVVLENVFDPHNVSAVMRTCDAVGIQDVYILNNRIPPHKKWGYRSSSTAANWLTIHQFTDAKNCFEEIRKRYEKVYTTHLSDEAVDLYSLDLTQSVALVFGNETFGVSDDIRRFSDGDFIIPQVGIIKSLNISVACAVTLYEAFRQKNAKGHYLDSRMPQSQAEAISTAWGIK
ncbi:RNA methyltransferase [Ginsengibacter hankyongi]|uniref:tRNA (guanosine(18)-2'-O)-methyltransferase n=1 Tax=Ginsengibacter hankyongi TaxID=2607284 RepID=A0A5J5IHM6_9BACT|nr:RNA methyltransferase [Ginsengibacter hankyongi]KAA9040479.1 RNA methyltransferase [Ginsengibacter hankyongi]